MRFIHTADVHLGYTPPKKGDWATERADEIWSTFERLIKEIREHPVDMLIIAGDLFDRQPLMREVKEVDYLFSTIPETKVVLMAGEHDAILPGSFYIDYKWNENVVFLSGRNIECRHIVDLGVDVYGLSYHSEEIREAVYDNIIIEHPNRINILVGHGGDRKCIPMNRRKIAALDFDYAAFGHLYGPDLDPRGRMAYSGSLEPSSTKDTGIRGYIMGEVTKEEGLELDFVPFSKRNYKHLIVEVNTDSDIMEVREKVKDLVDRHGADNIYKFTIKGKCNPLLEVGFEELAGICNLAEIVDKTIPDYDFESIYAQNKDNIIGMFIDKYIHSDVPMDEHRKKALIYGTRALLDATEER